MRPYVDPMKYHVTFECEQQMSGVILECIERERDRDGESDGDRDRD
jgi:hypothetical protein